MVDFRKKEPVLRWRRLLGIVWLIIVGAVSLLPLFLKQILHTTGALHSWGHLVAFAIAAALFYQPKANTRAKVVRILSIFLFSILLEWMQYAIYGSEFELPDVGVDAAGIFLGVAISSIVLRAGGSRTAATGS